MRLNQKNDDIGIRRPAPSRRDHRPVKPPARSEKARRINKDKLALALERDAANAGTGRLDLMGHNRHFRPYHAVGERRFPCVGFADQGDKSGTCGHVRPSRMT